MLTSISNYSGIVTPASVGLSGQEYDDFIKAAIERAYLRLRKTVPESTYNDAVAAIAGGVASPDQLELKWSEYWLTRYEIETGRNDLDVASERAGNLEIRKDINGSRLMASRFLNKALGHLREAGFELTGGDGFAGTRGGDPLPSAEPWFRG